jgi:hypothetical protein
MSMSIPLWARSLTVLSLCAACGGSKEPAAAPESAPAPEEGASEGEGSEDASTEAEAPAAASAGIPKECAKKGGSTCTPPKKFVEKLCSANFPGVALYLFANGSPWTRGYLRGKTKAWNASGGASDNESYLEFDEEVLVLAERKADLGGMQVSGAGASYDALRWDGSCVTLSSEEMTLDRPPTPKNSKVDWRFLDDNVQEALRGDSTVNEAYQARRKECKGATSGDVSLKCVKADEKLSAAVVKAIRGGTKLPEPTKVP